MNSEMLGNFVGKSDRRNGVPYFGGSVICSVLVCSPVDEVTVTLAMLKGLFPKRYGARQEVEMRVSSGQRVAGSTPEAVIERTKGRLIELFGERKRMASLRDDV